MNPGYRWQVVIAAHGEKRADADQTALFGFARRVGHDVPAVDVTVGFISAEPALGTALARLPPDAPVLVYPLLIADGFFLDRLRRAVAAVRPNTRVLEPFGQDPGLPGAILARLAKARNGSSAPVDLVLAAHGSRGGDRPRLAAERIATALRDNAAIASVTVAYVEQPPFLADAFATAPAGAYLAGLFTGAGVHAAGDVPAALAQAGRNDLVDLGIVTDWPESAAVAAQAIRAVVGGEGLEPPTSCV